METHKIDEHNFQDIFEAHFDPICRFLNLYTKDVDVIEDTVQNIFCKLWINRDFLSISHIRPYLYTAARNGMLNHIRNQKLQSQILATYMREEQELHEAYECVDGEEFIKRLDESIASLPPKCQTVFKMSRFSKMTYKEIARREGISVKMVEKHIHTALKKIKEKMRNVSFIFL